MNYTERGNDAQCINITSPYIYASARRRQGNQEANRGLFIGCTWATGATSWAGTSTGTLVSPPLTASHSSFSFLVFASKRNLSKFFLKTHCLGHGGSTSNEIFASPALSIC